MNRLGPWLLGIGAVLFLAFVIFVPQWRLPGGGRQLGPDGTSLVQFDPTPAEGAENQPPPKIPVQAPDTRPASAVYKNLQATPGMSASDFMRLQVAMTAWVSPKQGCGFCHVAGDFASDAKPQKGAARVMLSMTRHINAAWASHVGTEGVTCYSCHRGQPVPSEVWYQSPPDPGHPMIDRQEDFDERATTVRAFFPNEGFEEYLLQATPGLAQSYTALPTKEVASQIEFKRLYEVMMQMSDGIGVNCDFCHNSRAFFDWRQSTPNRWVGYSGIQLTRDINRNYLLNVGALEPLDRAKLGDTRYLSLEFRQRGPRKGNGLADCATCHHGSPTPLMGANLTADFPTLAGPDSRAWTQAASTAPTPTPTRP